MKSIIKYLSLSRLIIFACLFSLTFTSTAGATAGVYDQSFYSNNNILFYNPDDNTCTAGSSTSSASLAGNSNAERIWNWLRQQGGLTSEQAAGVMGNMSVETASTFSPTIQQIGSPWPLGGWGLVQWTNYPDGSSTGRRSTVVTTLDKQTGLGQYYDAKYSKPPTIADGGRDPGVPVDINIRLLDFELNYIMQESQGRTVSKSVASQGFGTAGAGEWDTLKQQKTVEDATVFWHNNFEVSSQTPAEVISSRGEAAKRVFNSFSSTTSTATSCPNTITSGSFSSYVLAYAWPDYHKAPYLQKTAAYQAAITKAKSEGRYVGADGIDCGGFITTLMVDSGFDPTYNNNGKGGNTDAQLAWLQAHWQNLGNGSSINPANLQPGDVAMLPGHTFVYVGHIPGFNSVIASSSLNERAPMAGKEQLTASNVTWFRKKA